MLTSRGQGLQLVDGFANQVQGQKAICDKAYRFWGARSENGC